MGNADRSSSATEQPAAEGLEKLERMKTDKALWTSVSVCVSPVIIHNRVCI